MNTITDEMFTYGWEKKTGSRFPKDHSGNVISVLYNDTAESSFSCILKTGEPDHPENRIRMGSDPMSARISNDSSYQSYSYLSTSTGFVRAARTVWNPTENQETPMAKTAVSKKVNGLIRILKTKS